jgi:hypothetical protein
VRSSALLCGSFLKRLATAHGHYYISYVTDVKLFSRLQAAEFETSKLCATWLILLTTRKPEKKGLRQPAPRFI